MQFVSHTCNMNVVHLCQCTDRISDILIVLLSTFPGVLVYIKLKLLEKESTNEFVMGTQQGWLPMTLNKKLKNILKPNWLAKKML